MYILCVCLCVFFSSPWDNRWEHSDSHCSGPQCLGGVRVPGFGQKQCWGWRTEPSFSQDQDRGRRYRKNIPLFYLKSFILIIYSIYHIYIKCKWFRITLPSHFVLLYEVDSVSYAEVWTRSVLCSSWCCARWRGWRRWQQIWTGHHMGGKSSVLCCTLFFKLAAVNLFLSLRYCLIFLLKSKPPALWLESVINFG